MSTDSILKTAASTNQTSFSFAVYGDCRTRTAEHQSVVDSMVTVSPDFYLNTGDLVEDGSNSSQWDSFFEIETELMKTATLFPSLGNHEYGHANYFDLFYLPGNERWYSFDYGNAHFTCLQIDVFTDYSVGSEQYLWLEQDLAGSNQTWKFVFFHLPPYSSGTHGNDVNVLDVRAVLPPLFEEHEVDMVLNGHDHDYEHSLVNDVTYIVSGGGGAPLYEKQFTNLNYNVILEANIIESGKTLLIIWVHFI